MTSRVLELAREHCTRGDYDGPFAFDTLGSLESFAAAIAAEARAEQRSADKDICLNEARRYHRNRMVSEGVACSECADAITAQQPKEKP